MLKLFRLTKENLVNLISFVHEDITFMIFHKFLQGIIRSKRNSRKLFNPEILIRQFIFIRSFGKFGKIKLIRFSIKLSQNFFLPTIYDSPTSIKEGSTKYDRIGFTSFFTKYQKISRIFNLTKKDLHISYNTNGANLLSIGKVNNHINVFKLTRTNFMHNFPINLIRNNTRLAPIS